MAGATYDNQRFKFEVRDDGSVTVFRPDQILVRHGGDESRLQDAFDLLSVSPRTPASPFADNGQVGHSIMPDLIVDSNWGVILLSGSLSERDAVATLNRAEVPAQLNNVYFIGTLEGAERLNYAAPNYAVPNYAVPNYAVPNYAVPNYAVPNYAVPNYAVPNYAVPNYAVGGDGFAIHGCGSNCKSCEPRLPPEIPANTARGARTPLRPLPEQDFGQQDFEIHVLDVRPIVPESTEDPEYFVDNATLSDLVQLPGALLPEAQFLDEARQYQPSTPDDRSPTLDDLKAEYRNEPFSPGRGANINGPTSSATSTDSRLDPAANHGEFIAGIIDQIISKKVDGGPPESIVTSWSVAGSLGDVSDSELVKAMTFVDENSDPDSTRIMSLSIAGYPDVEEISRNNGKDCLLEKIEELTEIPNGSEAPAWRIVASAGNDASCQPTRPASLPGVIAVAAYGPAGPAWFSNHGHWVDACAPGVEVVSRFPTGADEDSGVPSAFAGLELNDTSAVEDEFVHEYASWSGTSFAAPFAAAILARWAVERSVSFEVAVEELISHDDALAFPGYGTILSYRAERMTVDRDRPWI